MMVDTRVSTACYLKAEPGIEACLPGSALDTIIDGMKIETNRQMIHLHTSKSDLLPARHLWECSGSGAALVEMVMLVRSR